MQFAVGMPWEMSAFGHSLGNEQELEYVSGTQ